MKLKDIIKAGAEFLERKDAEREQIIKDAGIILAYEAWERNARRQQIRANAERARAKIIKTSGVMSDCCSSACLRDKTGEIICSECLEQCKAVKVKK